MKTIEISVPYAKKHLRPEIKQKGGKYDPENQTWVLPDNEENRSLAELIQRPISAPTQEERVNNVAKVAVDMLNALRFREFRLVESGDRIVIESNAIANKAGGAQ